MEKYIDPSIKNHKIAKQILEKEKLNVTEMLHVRISKEEKIIIEKNAEKYHFRSVSEYLRFLALNEWDIEVQNAKKN